MILALGLSILFSITIGIIAARNKKAESVVIPLLDVLQSIPILGFFPVVILGVIALIPSQMGVSLAVIILIFTSMSWNIAFGVYEAVKSIPQDYIDLTSITKIGAFSRVVSLYIPASLSKIAYNTQTSWAVGLFYLISSEILTLGNANFVVAHGIGVTIMRFWFAGDYTGYVYSIISLLVAVVIWQVAFLREFSLWAERFKFVEEPQDVRRDRLMRLYSWVNHRTLSKVSVLWRGRGAGLVSDLEDLGRWIKYAILLGVALAFVYLAVSSAGSAGRLLSGAPAPSTIVSHEAGIIGSLAFSFARIWYVYVICVVIGLPIGIGVSLHSRLYDALVPLIEVVASVPAPALLPVIYLASRGQGEVVAAVIIFVGMIWYMIFNVMGGIRTLPSEIADLKRTFHISTLQAWRNIYIPAAMTAFVTGSVTAVGAAWNTLIVAEYFSVSNQTLTEVGSGIGKTIAVATNSGDLLTLTLAVASMTVLVVAFNFTVWRRLYRYTTRRFAYNR